MKVLVCGGRDYRDLPYVYEVLDEIHAEHGITLIIQGGCSGADEKAALWAKGRGVPCLAHYADWKKHGKAAGPIRNAAMLKWEPNLVVAFPGGAGTASMVNIAKTASVPVRDERRAEAT
jgi:predicted Rossmann-fold nucleotide-binding protein